MYIHVVRTRGKAIIEMALEAIKICLKFMAVTNLLEGCLTVITSRYSIVTVSLL